MNWIDARAEFQARFDKLNQTQVDSILTELNQSMGTLIARGGLNRDTADNPQYADLLAKMKVIDTLKSDYHTLHNDIINYLKEATAETNLQGKLSENGDLQRDIQQLEKLEKEMKVDVDSAVARDELLRTRNTAITKHQLYLLGRPIRRGLIPYLWSLSLLFLGVAIFIFYAYAPRFSSPTGNGTNEGVLSLLYATVTDPFMMGSVIVASLIVILFLSLKIAGVLK